jgi:cytochrome c oxidase subunit 3
MMARFQQDRNKLDLTPKRFNMWIFIFTSFMMFAAFTSGFIVYIGGKGHALQTKLPEAFVYSTAVIVLSSITMFLASKAAKGLQFSKQRMYLWLTFILGVAFLGLQIYAWYIMAYRMKVYFVNPNASQSFF